MMGISIWYFFVQNMSGLYGDSILKIRGVGSSSYIYYCWEVLSIAWSLISFIKTYEYSVMNHPSRSKRGAAYSDFQTNSSEIWNCSEGF